MQIDIIDLEFRGTPHVIAAFLVRGPGGPVLVETGPASTLQTLVKGLAAHGVEPGDVRDVLVTHIHLDHAGAAGWWARQGARVWVHPIGAPHLVDPAKLLASAQRIYGDSMDTLWGQTVPAPADRVKAVEDGETIAAGGLKFVAVETPGHAWHHHVYRLDDIAFTGDAAGILLPDNSWIDLPAPPPEFHLERWQQTLARLRGLGLKTLYRTHFGPGADVEVELERFGQVLARAVEWIGQMLDRGLDRKRMVAEFTEKMRAWSMEMSTDNQDARAYELSNPRVMSVDGIARYLKKKTSS